jgi:phytoene dehydrogenase-like protein
MSRPPVVIVGGGHNGLVAGCFLAREGREVLLLEAADAIGGGCRTEATVEGHPDVLFDLHSVAHNLINMTDIIEELDLAGAGLRYVEMDPFSVAIHGDGRRVRFWRSVEQTVDSIAEIDRREARAYGAFMKDAAPLVAAALPVIQGQMSLGSALGRLGDAGRAVRRNGLLALARDVVSPYDTLLSRRLPSDLTRGPVAAFAAHAGVGPTLPGGSLYAFWQAAYHRFGQWHAMGGSRSLTDALARRLEQMGGVIRTSSPVERIERNAESITGVVLEGGERLAASAVITAVDPQLGLLRLLDPPLAGRDGQALSAARRGNVVQSVLHVVVAELPAYEGLAPGDHAGLQSYVDRLADLRKAWADAEAGLMPDPVPLYAFTTSSLDPGLAPSGLHSLYLASPAAPYRLRDGRSWKDATEDYVEACLATVERRAPGFARTVRGWHLRSPAVMAEGGRWPGAHPMHLDIAMDQLGPLRPIRTMGDHRVPGIRGLYVSGAGTNPSGGVLGTPGRRAARAVLADSK